MSIFFYSNTIFYAPSNESKLSSLAGVAFEIFAFPVFSISYAFKKLKIAITPEILIPRYLMIGR